jgi:predicted O-methyltransferase YrrM
MAGAFCVRESQPRSVLEIGTAIGYSALLMLMVLPEKAKLTTIELDETRLAVARDSFETAHVNERVTTIAGDAGLILPQLLGPFDFVFIDAAKGQYLNYLHTIIDKLDNNAVIFADNVLFRGMVKNTVETTRRYRTLVRRLQEYLNFVTSDKRFVTNVYDMGDGVAISYYQGDQHE